MLILLMLCSWWDSQISIINCKNENVDAPKCFPRTNLAMWVGIIYEYMVNFSIWFWNKYIIFDIHIFTFLISHFKNIHFTFLHITFIFFQYLIFLIKIHNFITVFLKIRTALSLFFHLYFKYLILILNTLFCL